MREEHSRDDFWYCFGIGAACAVVYGQLVYRPLSFVPEFVSHLILAALVLGCIAAGGVLSHGMTGGSLLGSILIGCGLYTLLAYGPLYGYLLLMGGILAAAVLLAAAYVLLLRSMKIQTEDPARRERIRKGRKRRAIRVARGILTAGFALMMAACVGAQILNFPAMEASAGEPVQQEASIDSSMDTLLLLQEEKWAQLTLPERLSVLQTVANIESEDLGLPEPLKVIGVSQDLSLGGSYDDADRTIQINLSNLQDSTAEETLDSLLHEVYHSYQHRLVEAYDAMQDEQLRQLMIFQNAAQYKAEFEDYTDSEEDLEGYYFQKCEQDARSYAELCTEYYFRKIESYLAENAEKQTAEPGEELLRPDASAPDQTSAESASLAQSTAA